MSGSASKFALGLVMIWGAMVAFYFAFHPNGVSGVTNPATALQWLIKEFQHNTGTGSPTDASSGSAENGPQNANAAPGGA